MQLRINKQLTTLLLSIAFVVSGCQQNQQTKQLKAESDITLWSVRMAESEMKRFPELWQFDHGRRLFFGYTQGLGAKAMLAMWQATGDEKYYHYVYNWADSIVGAEGRIYLYDPQSYNLDFVNSGKILFDLYAHTGEPRFKMAIDSMMDLQLRNQPRTHQGGYWHKLRYPYQMWLDGLYMAGPFLARYAKDFDSPEWTDEVIHQLTLVGRQTYDPKTGLFYHAWNSNRQEAWANPQTGCSPNFWGRSIGWYAMALVDVLDYIPEDHPRRDEVIELLQKLAAGMLRWQDAGTGLWYQVVDQGQREGNYLESSVSAMMMYTYAKGYNKGYLGKKYHKAADRVLDGLIAHRIVANEDNTISLTYCCAVSGLGGNPYRDGSFEYYVNERIRNNDGKATGPFILGCLELGR
ncbi:MAG: glycoside hydrolase family 88 protein [Bacteroidales bacterium]|nr:glycoside hydrolase family 88 protein [Bacteroidales bacterium]